MNKIHIEKGLRSSNPKINWSLVFATTSAVLSLLVLLGWTFNIDVLKRPLQGFVAMNPLTAIFFLCSAIAIYLKSNKLEVNILSIFGSVLSLVVFFLASIKFYGDFFDINFGIDTYVFQNSIGKDFTGHFTNRMAPNTAIGFVLTSLAILLINVKIRKAHLPSQFIAILIASIGLLSLLGYLYNVKSFYGFLASEPMSLNSAFCFLFMAFSILFEKKEQGFMQEITGNLMGAVFMRKLIPIAIMSTIGLGFLRLYISQKFYLPVELGVGLLILAIALFATIILWFSARAINHKHNEQIEAQKETRKIAQRLKLATHSGGVGIWEYDVETNELIWDEQIYRLHGLTNTNLRPSEARKKGLHPDDMQRLKDEIQTAILNSRDFESEYRVIWPDSTIRYLKAIGNIDNDSSGKGIRIIGTKWDITASKIAEEKLTEYKHFFTNSNDLVCIANTEGYLELVNPVFESKLGFTFEELTKNPFVDFIHPDDLGPTMETYERQVAGAEVINFINRYRKKDGSYVWLDWNARTNEQTGKLYCLARDITEQKRVSDELQQSHIFLDTIIENIPNMIFVKDATDLKFVRFNRAGENLLGYSREDLIGKNDFDFFPKEQAEIFKENDLKVLKNGVLVNIEEEKIQTSTGERWLRTKKLPVQDKNGKPIFLLGISEDITESKKAQEKLVEFKHFFHNSSDLAIILHMDGSTDTLNQNFSKILGYTEKELLKNNLVSLLHPDDLDSTLKKLDYLIGGKPLTNYEFRLRKKDGTYIWFEVNSTPNIESKKIYSTLRDTTTRKENEELLATQSLRLKMANEELETFSYSVSHDLRAPLRSLEGFSKALLSNYQGKLDEDADRWLNFIESNANRMGILINDMLAFSKVTRTEIVKTEINMKLVAQDVYNFEKGNYIGNSIQFDLDELPAINGDSAMIRQVWHNLISNALKYSSKQNEIKIKISCNTENGHQVYSVQDNGAGFDEKYKEKLFVVFQRLHLNTEYEGTGVGLAIANRIIRKHGGNIDATSKLGRGSTFTFTLPIN